MATEYSQLSQSERSHVNLETSKRRAIAAGVAFPEVHPPSRLELAMSTEQPAGKLVSIERIAEPLDGQDQRFCIEQLNGAGYWTLCLPAQYADKARDLLASAEGMAKALPGVKFRVRRVSGERAVLRIAARRNKETGLLECYSWSS